MEKKHIDSNIWHLMAKKLAGEASAEELSVLEQFLRENPSENYFIEIMSDLWNIPPTIDNQQVENKYKELVLNMQNSGLDEGKFSQDEHFINTVTEVSTIFGRKKWLALFASAAAVIIILLSFVFFNRVDNKKPFAEIPASNVITTKNGSKTNLVLPDGTKVWLNAGSKMTYDRNYGNTLREISLVGEAYFDVVKNPEKPFVIHTAKMDIKVLGTAFNVKCYPTEKTTETSLIRGSIEVTMKDRQEKIILKPNEKLIISNEVVADEKTILPAYKATPVEQRPIIEVSHLTYEPKGNAVIETSWLDNRLVFVNETFLDVATKMERWYGVKIIFQNKSLEKYHFTGTFENENINQALSAIQLTSQFNYKIEKDTVLIYK